MATTTLDPFLVVGLILLMILALVVNIYVLVYWQHPEDKNQSYYAKVLIILGLQLTAVSVFMLPIGKNQYNTFRFGLLTLICFPLLPQTLQTETVVRTVTVIQY